MALLRGPTSRKIDRQQRARCRMPLTASDWSRTGQPESWLS